MKEKLNDSIINGAVLFRGDVSERELRLIHKSAHLENAVKYNRIFHSELKTFKSAGPVVLPDCFNLRAEKCQGVGLFNSTLIWEVFKKIEQRFEDMNSKHHFREIARRFEETT